MQLTKIAGWNKRRHDIATTYDRDLADVVTTPRVVGNADHVFHQYTIRSSDRDSLIAALSENKVGYGIYYPIPCHRQAAFAAFADDRTLEETDLAAGQVLSIPIRPDLTEDEIQRVIDTITTGARA